MHSLIHQFKHYVFGGQKDHLIETVLLSTYNICLSSEINRHVVASKIFIHEIFKRNIGKLH